MPLPYTVWGLLVQKQVDGKKKGREREKERWGKIQWNGPICRDGLASYKNYRSSAHQTELHKAFCSYTQCFFLVLYSLTHVTVPRIRKDDAPLAWCPLRSWGQTSRITLQRKHQAPDTLYPSSHGIPDMFLWVTNYYPYFREKELNAQDFPSKTQAQDFSKAHDLSLQLLVVALKVTPTPSL